MTPEGKVLAAISKYLFSNGITFWRMNSSNGTFGMPDLIAIEPRTGKFIGIEVKAPGGKPTDLQVLVGDQIKKSNGIHIIAYSVEDVIQAIARGVNEDDTA